MCNKHLDSNNISDTIDVSQTTVGGTTSVDTNPVPIYGQPVFLAAKQMLLLYPHLSEEEDDSSEKSLSTRTESDASSSENEDIALSKPITFTVTDTSFRVLTVYALWRHTKVTAWS